MVLLFTLLSALALLVAFFVMNQKNEQQEREGVVKEILNKDALFVEFDDKRANVVRLNGVNMASEKEMLDEQIFEFLHTEIRGKRVRVNPVRVDTGDVLVSEVYSLADEYLNAILVRQGFGRWSPSEAANDKRIADAQETAQLYQQGVWNPAVQQLMAEGARSDSEEAAEDPESELSEEESAGEVRAGEQAHRPEDLASLGREESIEEGASRSVETGARPPQKKIHSEFKPGLL